MELVRLALGGRRRSEGLAAGRVHAAFVQNQHAERWGPFFGLQPVPHTIFQRPYSWNEETALELLGDIIDAMERSKQGLPRTFSAP